MEGETKIKKNQVHQMPGLAYNVLYIWIYNSITFFWYKWKKLNLELKITQNKHKKAK